MSHKISDVNAYVVGVVTTAKVNDLNEQGYVISGYYNNYADAVDAAKKAVAKYGVISAMGSTFVTSEQSLDKYGKPLLYWCSSDPEPLKRYLSIPPEVWKVLRSLDHPKSDKSSVYLDLDGTSGFWYVDNMGYASLEEVLDPANHYFREIEPHIFTIALAKELQNRGVDVCILSAADSGTIRDKWDWVHEFMPFIPDENIFFSPLGMDKAAFIKCNAEISALLDDYMKNVKKWPGIAIKAVNSVNSSQEIYPEIDISTPEQLLRMRNTPDAREAFDEAVRRAADKIISLLPEYSLEDRAL